eukprot:CAMPEP_0173406510 /NCGR_PEP_ID=MMETSP1356-20130122/64770_1 /TAXON_ID=77927 ORGANISM="Hemiselmis virescens, Strain PCC157" /NCGR_SAMPLE_ID=MMETSP1356 /ASSEMBLY_ACC=CAM_ASM_000847 /LENGTH=44 /DNA_ID= /DNA_START= /DNA_END= /DNA_ORIENTATION=
MGDGRSLEAWQSLGGVAQGCTAQLPERVCTHPAYLQASVKDIDK